MGIQFTNRLVSIVLKSPEALSCLRARENHKLVITNLHFTFAAISIMQTEQL